MSSRRVLPRYLSPDCYAGLIGRWRLIRRKKLRMRIAHTSSHLGGLEFLLIRRKTLWNEISTVLRDIHPTVGPTASRTVSRLRILEEAFSRGFLGRLWSRTTTTDLILHGSEQRRSHTLQYVSFCKDRILVLCSLCVEEDERLQRLEFAAGLYGLYKIDVAVEILVSKELLNQGTAPCPNIRHDSMFQSRTDPRVPLVQVSISN